MSVITTKRLTGGSLLDLFSVLIKLVTTRISDSKQLTKDLVYDAEDNLFSIQSTLV